MDPMPRWLLKTEPSEYSFADLERAGRARWDGVQNPLAQKHLHAIRANDEVLVYHTGAEKAVIGLARAASDAYPDPERKNPKLAVVDLTPVRRLARPVTLAAIKAEHVFAGWELVKMSRLSVMPVPDELWWRVLQLGGE
jgi:predicted RNA-binding protein with PUA-like domain